MDNSQITVSDNKKVIELNEKEFIADMGTLSLPFAADYERIGKNGENRTITQLEVQQKDGIVKVSGDADLGVPTLYDKSGFFALERIFIKQIKERQGKFVLNKNLDELTKRERTTASISLTAIAHEMGYKNPNMKVKANICDMIRRLNSASYTTQTSRFLTKDKTDFIMQAEKGFHLIEDYEIIAFTEQEKERHQKQSSRKFNNENSKFKYQEYKNRIFDGYIKITLSPIAYAAMVEDHYLFYYIDNALKLKNNIASSIYFLTLKWAGNNKQTMVNIDTLLNYIVFREDMELRYQKRNIKNAIKKIQDSGLGQISELDNGTFTFNYSNKKKTIEPTYLTEKFNTIPDLMQGYKDLGFKDEELGFIMNDIPNLHHYQAMLRYVTLASNSRYNKITNPKEYLEAMVKNIEDTKDRLDKKYYNKI